MQLEPNSKQPPLYGFKCTNSYIMEWTNHLHSQAKRSSQTKADWSLHSRCRSGVTGNQHSNYKRDMITILDANQQETVATTANTRRHMTVDLNLIDAATSNIQAILQQLTLSPRLAQSNLESALTHARNTISA